MKKILVIATHYLPGYKAGGPIRTLSNLVDRLGDEFNFYILTTDRDLKDEQPYPNIVHQTWQPVGKAFVRYLATDEQTWRNLRHIIQTCTEAEVIYINSFFAPLCVKTFFLVRRLLPSLPVIVAPRGEFSSGALRIKRLKKRLFLNLTKSLRLYRGVYWQSTSMTESQDIQRVISKNAPIINAPNLTSYEKNQIDSPPPPEKLLQQSRLVFISRISPKKNLGFALEILQNCSEKIHFDIYGPIDDASYWESCQTQIKQMPAHIQVNYKGVLKPEDVIPTFSLYHGFLFPTHGENFGHVILESLSAGCLVMTSDQTPWQDLLEHHIGWIGKTTVLDDFQEAIQELSLMNNAEFQRRSQIARDYAARYVSNPDHLEANRQMFCYVIDSAQSKDNKSCAL